MTTGAESESPAGAPDAPLLSPSSPFLSRWRRLIAYFIGLALFIGAIVIVWRQRDSLTPAFDSLREAPMWLLALSPFLIVANVILTGLHLQLLLSRFGRVPTIEMQMLIAATSLANYLPLRPGLVGRLVYHKQVHRIRLRDSARTQIESLAFGLFVIVAMLPMMLLAGWLDVGAIPFLFAPLVVSALAAVPSSPWRIWLSVFALKYADIFVWTGRYVIAFELVGQPIGFVPAAALAMIAMLASTMPFVSNGLGLRELLIGFLAPVITMWGAGFALEGGSSLGIAADLVNRAFEVITVLVVGLIGFAWLGVRHRFWALRANPTPSPTPESE